MRAPTCRTAETAVPAGAAFDVGRVGAEDGAAPEGKAEERTGDTRADGTGNEVGDSDTHGSGAEESDDDADATGDEAGDSDTEGSGAEEGHTDADGTGGEAGEADADGCYPADTVFGRVQRKLQTFAARAERFRGGTLGGGGLGAL